MEMDINWGNLGNRAFRCQTFKWKNKENKLYNLNMGKFFSHSISERQYFRSGLQKET